MNHLTTYHLSEGIFETLQVFLIYELCNLTRVAVSKLSEPVGKLLALIYQPFNFFASLPGKNFTANFEI
jgi:hypothetical protein